MTDPTSHDEGGAADLADDELGAVVAAVQALVDNDSAALSAMGAYENGADPYTWTRDYGQWDEVHLRMPPGEPRTWSMSFVRSDAACHLDVDMWTAEEGRSDLTLQLVLTRTEEGAVRCTFEDLHVL